jgi:two-component system OmpR family sensor kinase
MWPMRSIRVRLSVVFCFFLLLVVLLGSFSVATLSYVNGISADIRNRWLESTRLLGDLNNFTSDFRAAEGDMLLSAGASDVVAAKKSMADLDEAIAQAEHGYESVRHDGEESALYARFRTSWTDYRAVVDRVMALAATDERARAVPLYQTTSRSAYDNASDILGQLTDRTVAAAAEASGRAELAYRTARWLIGVAILAAGLMVAGAVTYIRRSISEPVLDLAGRMYRLAANETDLDIHGAERLDEIGEMARAVIVFRNNAIDLAVSRHALTQQASMLAEKLAEEQRLTRLQRNFVSMASHEFRTPLTIIDAHAQRLIAMKERLSADELALRAGKIRSAVLRMTNLIDGLLNSSRLVDGDVGLYFHPAEIDVAALLHEVIQLHREIAPRSQISENFGAQPLPMSGDAKLLFQVFSNLLSNAIKYSPDGGLIKVTAGADGDWTVVTVEDHGIGIPEADLDRLFERYYRGANVSGIVGTGVGLYFVKTVVELHRGNIVIESKQGEGSRFTVRLPIGLPVAAEADAPPHEMAASSDQATSSEARPQQNGQVVIATDETPLKPFAPQSRNPILRRSAPRFRMAARRARRTL